MALKYELIDAQTFDLVGAYDDVAEVERVLKYDLEQNGPDSVRNLVLFVGTDELPDTSVDGDELLRIAYGLVESLHIH